MSEKKNSQFPALSIFFEEITINIFTKKIIFRLKKENVHLVETSPESIKKMIIELEGILRIGGE